MSDEIDKNLDVLFSDPNEIDEMQQEHQERIDELSDTLKALARLEYAIKTYVHDDSEAPGIGDN